MIIRNSLKINIFIRTGFHENDLSVKGYFFISGQKAEFRLLDFIGIADEEQLPEQVTERLSEIRSPKMKIRIFQTDYNKSISSARINPAEYRQIYGGTVNCSGLESVFSLCNQEQKPPGYCGYSLSVSDIVEICGGENKGFYFCDSSGFRPIEFEISQTDHNKMFRVLILEHNKEPYVAEIPNCPEVKQTIVGGQTEKLLLDDIDEYNEAFICCNEKFLLSGQTPNRILDSFLPIHGTFMIIGERMDDDGEIFEKSLTDEQIEKFTEQFRYPLIYIPKQEQTEEETEYFGFFQSREEQKSN